MTETKDIFDKLSKTIEYDLKPHETQISTMTIILYMKDDIKFDCYNIGRYLKTDEIIDGVIFNDADAKIHIRGSLETQIKSRKKLKKTKEKKTKNKKDSFYNQVTVIVKVSNDKMINIKLFKNGSIQMTGCNSLENSKKAIEYLFTNLNTTRYLIFPSNDKIKEIQFINTQNITLSSIIDGKVALINFDFTIEFEINRDKLFNIMSNKNLKNLVIKKKSKIINDINSPFKYIDGTFDPIRHACVNIKLQHPIKTITIFVFESGSIIILGKSCRQIRDAYNFINVFLLTNYYEICNNLM